MKSSHLLRHDFSEPCQSSIQSNQIVSDVISADETMHSELSCSVLEVNACVPIVLIEPMRGVPDPPVVVRYETLHGFVRVTLHFVKTFKEHLPLGCDVGNSPLNPVKSDVEHLKNQKNP